MSQPCAFFNKPGGCKKGASCRFHHGSTTSSKERNILRPLQSPKAEAPPGVCRFFWNQGSCKHEFQCRFKHQAGPEVKDQQPSADSSTRPGLVPFLTEEGLAKLSRSGTDGFFPSTSKARSPADTHNALKRFLYDDYRFKTPMDAYAFLTLLNNANTTNALWSQEDGQLLLDSIATGNGVLRLGDIIRWETVAFNAGTNRVILSFQHGYIPLLRFFSSDIVVKSTLSHRVNALYSVLHDHFDDFAIKFSHSMDEVMKRRSFKDPLAFSQDVILGSQVFVSLAVVLFECLTRFKNASATSIQLIPMVRQLSNWAETWCLGISSPDSNFDDPMKTAAATVREHILTHLKGKIARLQAIADREEGRLRRSMIRQDNTLPLPVTDGIVAALSLTFEGPGDLRPDGKRHDNDFADINDIRIVPTHHELTSSLPPYLPANFYAAPHHHPAGSMSRLLDIQFRLLREELTAPIRTAVQLVRGDLLAGVRRTTLAPLIKKRQEVGVCRSALAPLIEKRGGKYRGALDGQETMLFNVYTGVSFLPLVPDRRGLSVGLEFDTPPGRARLPQSKARVAFWEGMSSKRLIQGGLVALIWQRGTDVEVHMGILSSSLKELTESARQSVDKIRARVTFFDSVVELHILNELKLGTAGGDAGMKLLIEAPVMFESIRPFLEALRVEPETLPFDRYLVHHPTGHLGSVEITPPLYTRVPGFRYQLRCLFPATAGVQDLTLDPSDPGSVAQARVALKDSRLDDSQAEAVVDALTRELALIQGPPGTGKSFTGVEILRVLIANNIRPILLIAFTNHALDHLLCSILDAQITNKIVRLGGSKSVDERIRQFSIENLEMTAGESRLNRSFARDYRDLKTIEEEISKLMKRFAKADVSTEEILQHIETFHPEQFMHVMNPPDWIIALKEAYAEENAGWIRAGRARYEEDDSLYAFWRDAHDLDFLTARPAMSADAPAAVGIQNRFAALEHIGDANASGSQEDGSGDAEDRLPLPGNSGSEEDESSEEDEVDAWQKFDTLDQQVPSDLRMDTQPVSSIVSTNDTVTEVKLESSIRLTDLQNPADFFTYHGYEGIPRVPDTDSSVESILEEGIMWTLSRRERERLHAFWTNEARQHLHSSQVAEFENLRKKHAEALDIYNQGQNEKRRQLLKNVDIVGATTTAAAKLISLLKGLSPRAVLVEEAGQVLEAHILGGLVPSVEHLILIGDPLQLRPTLNNFHLSVDSRRGRELYKFDRSLMERLSTGGLPMSQIQVQRRMRPSISKLIRHTLYPRLIDHDLVTRYPDVRGFTTNVFFLSHDHREGGNEEESVSKYNTYEVAMIKDMVLYLLRQGCYSQEGDIVVLCAYLGQLAKLRDALAAEVAVVIDDRDQQELADREAETVEEDTVVERVKVSQRVRLRTVDNYQGEEAKIIILSLVRNAGSDDMDMGRKGGIGFLKSENRANVALSRAKEGLFILGNAPQMASRSVMWQNVVEELENDGCIGSGLPISCQQHPDTVELISRPGMIPKFAPDGGCLRPCNARLKCGHVCPYKCHPDDPNHCAVLCSAPCTKLCKRQHPCEKSCSDSCGNCRFQIANVELPCGHTCPRLMCYQLDALEEVRCHELVSKSLPTCEHSAMMKCSDDPADFECQAICSGILQCCGRTCKAKCHQCQDDSGVPGLRTKHQTHPCEKLLYCAHLCGKPCSVDHQCTEVCREPCRQECSHSRCRQYCSSLCAPCQKPCTWNCRHFTCPVPCGSACIRLPCDERCTNQLPCGHRCPSLCGEDCSIQKCPICASPEDKDKVVDLILVRTLREIPPEGESLDELIITLPKCRHFFTAETLDGHCGLSDLYERKDEKWVGLKSPESSATGPPICPTCRQPITSPRYGRAFKSADLDILEKNVISRNSQALRQIQEQLSSISTADMESRLLTEASKLNCLEDTISNKHREMLSKARKRVLKTDNRIPAEAKVLDAANTDLYALSVDAVMKWRVVTRSLMNVYQNVIKIAETRSAHSLAWEASFSFIYQAEMDHTVSDPSRAPRNPREYAMRLARMKVGQLQPRADKRFLVEAFWATLQIRFILADLVMAFIRALPSAAKAAKGQVQMWGMFGSFLLETCKQDAEMAYKIAQESESRRQMTTTALLIMRVTYERFRFDVEMNQQIGILTERRLDLANRAAVESTKAEVYAATVSRAHISVLRQDKDVWIPEKFISTSSKIIAEWKKMEKSLRAETFYQPVSLDELTAIVGAMNFSHTGHWYRCINGHPFVITECGGAMERASCSECGAPIGGSNHALDASNSSATELENIGRQRGAERSPWPWAPF